MSEEVGSFFVGLFLLGLFVWLTWFVIVWLGIALAVFFALRYLCGRLEGRATKFWHVTLAQALRVVAQNVVIGLAILTAVQFVVNVCYWAFGQGSHLDDKLPGWLWESEQTIKWVRRWLIGLLHPRVTLLLIAGTLLVAVARPDLTLVKRIFGGRKYLGWSLQVLTIMASMSFFTGEYVAIRELSTMGPQLDWVRDKGQLSRQYAAQIVACNWVANEIRTSDADSRKFYASFVNSAAQTSHAEKVVAAEAERLTRLWAPEGEKPAESREKKSDDVERTLADLRAADRPSFSSPTLAKLEALALGPSAPHPTQAETARVDAGTERLRLQASEAEAAAVEAAKLTLGQLLPADIHPILKMFVSAVANSAATTFVPRVLAKTRLGIEDQIQAAKRDVTNKTGDAASAPSLARDLAIDRAEPSASTAADPTFDLDVATVRMQERLTRTDESLSRADEERRRTAEREAKAAEERRASGEPYFGGSRRPYEPHPYEPHPYEPHPYEPHPYEPHPYEPHLYKPSMPHEFPHFFRR